MSFNLMLIKNDGSKTYNITPLVSAISWESNLGLQAVINFSIMFNDMPKHFPKNPIDLGDVVILTKGEDEIIRGEIVEESRSGRQSIVYRARDYAWLLSESTIVKQFRKISASQAIEQILRQFGIPIGKIASMNTLVTKIYIEKSPAEIIKDIVTLEEAATGKRFNAELKKGKIYFEEMKDLVIKGSFKLADNLKEMDVMDFPLDADRTRTIEKMRNRIKILIENDSKNPNQPKYEVVAEAKNQELIQKYGLLEDTFKIDVQDKAKAREVARILLQRLGKIHETNTITLMGDHKVKAGRYFDVEEQTTGMSNRFMIVSVNHTLTSGVHTMQVELALPEEVR